MFIASKYQDVIPLRMSTVIKKIGHNKFDTKLIQEKELEILKVISFKIGTPTVKEFLDRFISEFGYSTMKTDQFYKMCTTLAKLACHSYELMQLSTSLLAGSILYVGL